MNSKERVLQREYNRGRPEGKLRGKSDALELASRASSMDSTAIIAEEDKVPLFVWGTDYSACPQGTPIGEMIDGHLQVFTMITPINTVHYPGITPNTERSLFSLCHTKDPAKAKPFMDAQGISGMYQIGECCLDAGQVWRNKMNDNVHRPSVLPEQWENLGDVSTWAV